MGGDWRALGPSNFGGKVYGVAVDPRDAQTVYAAYEVGGLWGTHNGGRTWLPLFDGQSDVAFASVATHPTVPGLVAAGLIAYGGGYSRSLNVDVGIRLSTNAGATWHDIGPTVDPTATVWNVSFGDSSGQTIYAATDEGLYKTTNQGGTWVDILPYSATSFFDDRVSLAVDPLNFNVVLLAQRTIGVMRSTDGGGTWARVDTWVNPGPASGNPTILAWSSGATVYAEAETNGNNDVLSTYRSLDAGATWSARATTSAFNQGPYDMALAVDPYNAKHVILHNSDLQFSTDGLRTIQETDPAAAGPDALAVVFDPEQQGVVYDGNDEGLHRSADGGTTWGRFDVGVLTTKADGGSAYGVAHNGNIYTNPADYAGQQYIAGYGWLSRPDGYEFNEYYVNPHDPTDLYNYGDDLWRSPTAAHPGQDIDPTPGVRPVGHAALDFDPVDANTLYLGKQALFRSTDRGTTWTQLAPVGTGVINLVKIAPSNQLHIYVVSNDQVWSTLNGGASWSAGTTLSGTNMIAVSPSDENTLYFATANGIFKSTNGGQSSTRLAAVPQMNVRWVVVDPSISNQVYAATNFDVLASTDDGTSWQRLGTSLPLVETEWMTIVAGNLYAGTQMGVWEINLRDSNACSQVSFNPPSVTVGSGSQSVTVEVYVADGCAWNATSNATWTTIATYGSTHGHGLVTVSTASNAGPATSLRTAKLKIAGKALTLTQLGGPALVQNGSTITLTRQGACVTAKPNGLALGTAPCHAGDPTQQFTLQRIPNPPGFFVTNSSSGGCWDVSYGALQTGTPVLNYPCNFGPNEFFRLRPQPDGGWNVQPSLTLGATPLCVRIGATRATEALCSASQEVSIAPG